MIQFIQIITIIFPVFLVMILGNVLRHLHFFDEAFIRQANKFLFHVSLPMLLFYKIGGSDFTQQFNGRLVAGCALSIFLIAGAAYLYAVIRGYPPKAHGVFAQGAFRGNLAIVGLAVVLCVFGEEGVSRAGILMGFIVPWLNLLAIVVLVLPHTQGRALSWGEWLKPIAGNPLIIASFMGMGWSFAELPFPPVLENTLQIVSDMTLPLALICIGAEFSLKRFQGDRVRAMLACSLKIVWMPILTAGILSLLGVHGVDFAIGIVMIGSPTAAASYIMASQMKGDASLAGAIIVVSTLLSIVTYSVMLYFLLP